MHALQLIQPSVLNHFSKKVCMSKINQESNTVSFLIFLFVHRNNLITVANIFIICGVLAILGNGNSSKE